MPNTNGLKSRPISGIPIRDDSPPSGSGTSVRSGHGFVHGSAGNGSGVIRTGSGSGAGNGTGSTHGYGIGMFSFSGMTDSCSTGGSDAHGPVPTTGVAVAVPPIIPPAATIVAIAAIATARLDIATSS